MFKKGDKIKCTNSDNITYTAFKPKTGEIVTFKSYYSGTTWLVVEEYGAGFKTKEFELAEPKKKRVKKLKDNGWGL